MKIEINIEDNRKFALVAYLVDREDFIEDIRFVRKRINNQVPYQLPTYPFEEANSIANLYHSGQLSINGTIQLLEDFCRDRSLMNLHELDNCLGTTVLYAESICKKYGKTRIYVPVVVSSILVGHVEEEDFLTTQIFQINMQSIKKELENLDKEEEIVAITVSRESTIQELELTYDFIRKYYFKSKKTRKSDTLINAYPHIRESKLPDTASNIRRDRVWYWMHKEELGKGKGVYTRIMDRWNSMNPEIQSEITDQNIIQKAISRYKSLLKS